MRTIFKAIVSGVILVTLSGCALLGGLSDAFNRAWQGVPALMQTYTSDGVLIDSVHGASFQVVRDSKFDTTDSEGKSGRDSSVLSISLGDDMVHHVGSTLILAQDGLQNIMESTDTRVTLTNSEPGTPWLNRFFDSHQNLWAGRAKTVMIRSQFGTPIAVYTGHEVELYPTDIPKATWFRVDGKYLLVYRADYTVYDTALLK